MSNSGGNTFKERFVVETSSSSAAGTGDDEFTSIFSSFGRRLSHGLTTHYHSRMVWLEQSNRGGVLHYNVATNQKVYGIPQGAGNLLESLSLFFHLLKKLSPHSVWLQIPHEIRITLESLLAAAGPGTSSGLSGGLINGLSTSAALGY
jgi:hypothetical protein